jgi:magnesium transporter
MAYLSEIINRKVTDYDGNPVGIIKDLVAKSIREFPHPMIEAIVIQGKKGSLITPYEEVAALMSPTVPLKRRTEDLTTYTPGENDIFLARDVLDTQIIDTNGARVVRVNDVELVRVNGTVYVGNVDIGTAGILRRLGLVNLANKLDKHRNSLAWNNIELMLRDQSMRLRVPVDKIHDLHPADVADILSDMNKLDTGQLLESMDVPHLADALEEVEPEFQVSLVENMSDEKVADVLEEMEPDEAADLLGDLPKGRKEDLLALMEKEDADDVRKLLTYPENTAGGIMTTEFASIRPNLAAAEAIKALRAMADEVETMFYVYVTDDENCLLGVFSLNQLIFASPGTQISEFMAKRVVTVNLYDDQDMVAQTVAKYDLLAVPVVDDQNHLHGVVTADDALDKMIPTAWKKRLPRFYR